MLEGPLGDTQEHLAQNLSQLAFQPQPHCLHGKAGFRAHGLKDQQLPLLLQIKINFSPSPPGAGCQTPPQLSQL